jgi:hypothetical protein
MITGEYRGEIKIDGYGNHPVIDCNGLPNFRNVGFNVFLDSKNRQIEIKNMRNATTQTCHQDDFAMCHGGYVGWIYLKYQEKFCKVFIGSTSESYDKERSQYIGDIYNIQG